MQAPYPARCVRTSARRPRRTTESRFEEKMARLTAQWQEQQAEARKLDATIEANLKELGYGG